MFTAQYDLAVSPPQPIAWSRPSIVTTATSSGISTPLSERVNGCSLAWSWVRLANAVDAPSAPTTRHASAYRSGCRTARTSSTSKRQRRRRLGRRAPITSGNRVVRGRGASAGRAGRRRSRVRRRSRRRTRRAPQRRDARSPRRSRDANGLIRDGTVGRLAGMRVVFATAELSPVATVGGLAAAAAGLGAELRRAGVDLELVMPDYGDVALVDETTIELDVPGVGRRGERPARAAPESGRCTSSSVPGMARPHPYLTPSARAGRTTASGSSASPARVAAYVEHDPPDVLHLNDWHTGPVAGRARPIRHRPSCRSTTSPTRASPAGVARRASGRGAHYEWWGDTNPLSGALALADRIVAVSPHYAREITTPRAASGSTAAARPRRRADRDPQRDRHRRVEPGDRPAPRDDVRRADARRVRPNRAALARAGRVPRRRRAAGDDRHPADAPEGRRPRHAARPAARQIPMRLACSGRETRCSRRSSAGSAEHPDTLAFVEGYDEALSHLMFAGATCSSCRAGSSRVG